MAPKTTITNTAGKFTWKGVISTVVGFVVAWVAAHLTGWNLARFATIWPLVTMAYLTGISWLEAKFPKLSWLFALLPKSAPPVTPVVPTPAPAPVAPVTASSKGAAKK